MKYLFQLGHQPHLSIAELEAIFTLNSLPFIVVFQSKEYLILASGDALLTQDLMNQLGGTIKIGYNLTPIIPPENYSIVQDITNYLDASQGVGKIQFSVSGDNAKPIALKVKKELKARGRSVRFVEPKNTATIIHNNLIEKLSDFTIINNEIFITNAVQDIAEFSKRDYERPESDNRSGMLPPKLARIMINLSEVKKDAVILDPFCGSGTILTEALSLGFTNVIGTDISQKAVDDTQENLKWICQQAHNGAMGQWGNIKQNIFKSDAQSLDTKIPPSSIDAIISEPYLGKPLKGNESKSQLLQQVQELKELYVSAFKEFHRVLKPNGVIVFIIPKFKYENEWIEIDCVEEIKQIGFTSIPLQKQESLTYFRPQQFVGREIWRFKKNTYSINESSG